MTQNLASPSVTPAAVAAFLERTGMPGSHCPPSSRKSRDRRTSTASPPCAEARRAGCGRGDRHDPAALARRIAEGCYDIAQPDATVIGGVGPVHGGLRGGPEAGVEVYVHCWGAGVGMLANYHAALAGGGARVEWPMPSYPLRRRCSGISCSRRARTAPRNAGPRGSADRGDRRRVLLPGRGGLSLPCAGGAGGGWG